MTYKVKHSFYKPHTFSSSCTHHKGWWCSNTCQTLPSGACSKKYRTQLLIFISSTQLYRTYETKWQISLEKREHFVQKHQSCSHPDALSPYQWVCRDGSHDLPKTLRHYALREPQPRLHPQVHSTTWTRCLSKKIIFIN